MKKLILTVFLTLSILGGCEKQQNKSNIDESSLKIRAGFMCGWGSGEDSLYISSAVIKYVYSVPAQSNLPKIIKTRATTDAEWNIILNSFDMSTFVNLDYNSCNICVDGCDEWIKIQDDQISHRIQFGLGLKIDSISDLQAVIAELRAEFKQ